jgi:hypothetical protein
VLCYDLEQTLTITFTDGREYSHAPPRGRKARTSTSTSAADIEAPRGNAPARLKNFFGKYPK